MRWVSERGCCMCLTPGPVQVHHLKHIGGFSGVGLKAPDWMTMPLCGDCHRRMHEDPEMWGMQYPYLLRTLEAAFKEGVLREA